MLRKLSLLTMGLAACSRTKDPDPPAPLLAPIAPDAAPASATSATSPTTRRSTGCASPRAQVQGETRTTSGNRTFHVWSPSGNGGTQPSPVLFTFHGWSSNGPDFQKWFRMEDHVDGQAIVVYPDSLGTAWDFTGDRDIDFFDAMLRDLEETYCIDPSRVFAFGFSYGGRFVYHLACARAAVLHGIAVGGSDWRTAERRACGRVPLVVTHRKSDTSESIEGGRAGAARWAGINGCTGGDVLTDAKMGCRSYSGCAAPVLFCEDQHHDPKWPASWNHTVREEYQDLTWRWLAKLP